MNMNAFEEDFEKYLKAGIPVLSIATYEWQRLHGFGIKIASKMNREFYVWSQVLGVRKWSKADRSFEKHEPNKDDPIDVLEWFRDTDKKNIILLLEDFHPFITEGNHPIIRRVRELTQTDAASHKSLLIQTPCVMNVNDFEKEIPILKLNGPQAETLSIILENIIQDLDYDYRANTVEEKKEIIAATLGMSSVEAEWTYKKIIAEKDRLTRSEIPLIVKEKEQIIKKGGILEYFHPEGDFNQVGGMKNLKEWLKKRGQAFSSDAKAYGLPSPKGVMLLGIPGCGKSLIAKTFANEWQIPLLKFDLGKVFGGIVGESESNIRKALSLAETIAPSILWIDEIEKGLSGLSGGGDSGTSARVFGHFLTWMQDKKSEVFVIATANNIEQLPPELLRKGRFDEIFFVDLPSKEERKTIFQIHIEKAKRNVKSFELTALAEASQTFSGAEIEEAVVEAMFISYDQRIDLNTETIIAAIKATYPLSQTMSESIQKLRKWAKVRARFASDEESEPIPENKNDLPTLKQEKKNPFI